MNNNGVHRATPTSKAGRRMIVIGHVYDPRKVPPEIRAWNAEVDRKNQEKHKSRLKQVLTAMKVAIKE